MWPIRVRGESQWGKPFHYHKQITEYYYRQAVCVQKQRMGAKGYLINDREGATLDLCWPLNSLLQPNLLCFMEGLPSGSVIKNPSAYAGDASSIPGLVRSSGKENGNPLQCSCLENPVDRGAWWATVHGVARVTHDLATKPPPPPQIWFKFHKIL